MDTKTNDVSKVKIIKPINVDTVHKICSGQVVLNLAVAVKELVENSLDAGASSIDVKFKNYGLDSIEVLDNGTGITEDNFAPLVLKYHTSKLNDYSDLMGVTTFGFRGEALSSLCALAKLVITTRHQNSEYATKIEYDHKGNIIKTTPCSRQIGTTVTLSNLFYSLPVRQKEFQKNVKREFTKMTHLLYAYCLISIGVKITCTNQTNSNSKTMIVCTQGSNYYKDNIASIFGSKQLNTLLEIKPEYTVNIKENIFKGLNMEIQESDENIEIADVDINLSEDSNDDGVLQSQSSAESEISSKSQGYKNGRCPVQFAGFISSCAHGSGRSSTDRQFYFINSRPCEPIKIMKLVNEIYHQFNPNQYPFIFLNIELERSFVDVNVTPDKRKVFLTKEKIILDVIKCSLLKLFENIPRTLKLETTLNIARCTNELEPTLDQPRVFTSFLQSFANKRKENIENCNKPELKRKSTTILDYTVPKSKKTEDTYEVDETNLLDNSMTNVEEIDKEPHTTTTYKSMGFENEKVEDHTNKEDNTNKMNDIVFKLEENKSDLINHSDLNLISPTKNKEVVFLEFTDRLPDTQIRSLHEVMEEKDSIKTKNVRSIKCSPPISSTHNSVVNKVTTDKEDLGKCSKNSVVMKTSLEHVKALTEIFKSQKKSSAPEKIKFRTAINPALNNLCEEELNREISKSSFKQMSIVGQFNLGFIIAHLNDDLFIIDQHATDEIYNFETLQKTTELTSQKLVIPQQLELSGVNEQILMDNLEVFKKNGFTFDIDESGLPTKRVKLIALPMSKNWVFGKEDIEELLFMLRESTSEFCRPSRIRAMFASRACRKSVMIGTALSKSDMKTLVDHMAQIEKPWNCPHGRPTIRHLVNLAVINVNDSKF